MNARPEWTAIQVAIKIARREGVIRADDEGDDFVSLQCSYTLNELRESSPVWRVRRTRIIKVGDRF